MSHRVILRRSFARPYDEDIDCPTWMDWFHGGLQFQTEHHLVPRMPRHKLRKFRSEVVKPFCEAHGLTHDAPSFWEANAQVWRTLKVGSVPSSSGVCRTSTYER